MLSIFRCCFIACQLLFFATVVQAQTKSKPLTFNEIARQSDEWYSTAAGQENLERILSYQTPSGGWCKGYTLTAKRANTTERDSYGEWSGTPTIDNHATTTEINILAKATRVTKSAKYREATERGLDFLLKRQYENGGWPQRSPIDGGRDYGTHITLNDGAMLHVLEILRAIESKQADWAWLDEQRRQQASQALERGIECLLKMQIKVGDQLTVWCAQHDAKTLKPAPARAYELASLSGGESAGIVKFLMSIPRPNPRLQKAIRQAVAWYENSKITGFEVQEVKTQQGKDKVLVANPQAEPLWARFYELDSNRPIFCSRDGVVKYKLSEISQERRTGYAWYGTWGKDLQKSLTRWEKELAKYPAAR
jgi:PelA/Pel-15E family pectate lyase